MVNFLTTIGYILLAVVIFLVMIVIHEFGHYIAGKVLKFKINEFSVGFGPKLLQKETKSGEKFTLRMVPLGGYCAFEGEEEAAIDESKTDSVSSHKGKAFNDEKAWKRIIVFVAGAGFNLISAVIFSFIFIWCIGHAIPTVSKVYVSPQGGSYCALLEGDVIQKIDGKEINILNPYEELVAKIEAGESVEFEVLRDGKLTKVNVKKQEIVLSDDTYIGFGFEAMRSYEGASFGNAIVYCVPFTGKLSLAILKLFGDLIMGKIALTSMTGPVGTISTIADYSQQNWRNILILLPLIASNIAIFNLLPFPALDGSKVALTALEWIRGKPIKRNVENIIHLVGIVALLGFIIIIDLIWIFMRMIS